MHPQDSSSKRLQKADFTSSTQLTSLGYFSFGGRLVSDNPAFSTNFAYDRKSWGASLYKVFDLYDHHTANNFTMALLYKNLRLGERFTITPNAGIVLEQLESFADHASDFTTMVTSQFKLTNRFTLEHTAMLSNFLLEKSHMDWVNRAKVIYEDGQYNITWLAWHNNNLLDSSSYYSTALSIFYNNIEISDRFHLNSGVTGL